MSLAVETNCDKEKLTGKPEFKFSKETDTEVIDADDDNEEYRNPYSGIQFLTRNPVTQDQSRCCQLVWSNDDVSRKSNEISQYS